MEKRRVTGLRQQVLIAALECSGGDLQKTFTAEDLLLKAWANDPLAWGLRGYERVHPDSEKIYTEIDRASVRGENVRGGLVGLGLFEKVRQRTYQLTPAGLAAASDLRPDDPSSRGKAERALGDAVRGILGHPVFTQWLVDQSGPKNFRDAGHFWGIAPGTPPRVIRERVRKVEITLNRALELLDSKGVDDIGKQHGSVLFDRTDVERCLTFQAHLKTRFAADLRMLGAEDVIEPGD